MARAHGANAVMAAAFEATYGTSPAAGYKKLPFVSSGVLPRAGHSERSEPQSVVP